MKRKTGKLFGKLITIRFEADQLQPDVLTFDGTSIKLGGNLPAKLAAAMPPAYATQPVGEWAPFVSLAVAKGLL